MPIFNYDGTPQTFSPHISPEELGYLDEVVAGTMSASKIVHKVDGIKSDVPDVAITYFRRDSEGRPIRGSGETFWHSVVEAGLLDNEMMGAEEAIIRDQAGHHQLNTTGLAEASGQ